MWVREDQRETNIQWDRLYRAGKSWWCVWSWWWGCNLPDAKYFDRYMWKSWRERGEGREGRGERERRGERGEGGGGRDGYGNRREGGKNGVEADGEREGKILCSKLEHWCIRITQIYYSYTVTLTLGSSLFGRLLDLGSARKRVSLSCQQTHQKQLHTGPIYLTVQPLETKKTQCNCKMIFYHHNIDANVHT